MPHLIWCFSKLTCLRCVYLHTVFTCNSKAVVIGSKSEIWIPELAGSDPLSPSHTLSEAIGYLLCSCMHEAKAAL